MPHPKTLAASKHGQGETDPSRQYDGVFTQRTHFVDEHEGKKHDEKYLCA